MSLLVVGLIAGMALIMGLIVTLAEKIRAVRHGRKIAAGDNGAVVRAELRGPQFVKSSRTPRTSTERTALSATAQEDRASAYRQILDRLGDDLDQDIAEWEAVLDEFPQVLLADDNLATDERSSPMISEETCQDRFSPEEQTVEPKRTRRIESEERGQIIRLSNTGFAAEEIALWLNLPLERVQEVLGRP
jgi:hypothetical protein